MSRVDLARVKRAELKELWDFTFSRKQKFPSILNKQLAGDWVGCVFNLYMQCSIHSILKTCIDTTRLETLPFCSMFHPGVGDIMPHDSSYLVIDIHRLWPRIGSARSLWRALDHLSAQCWKGRPQPAVQCVGLRTWRHLHIGWYVMYQWCNILQYIYIYIYVCLYSVYISTIINYSILRETVDGTII